MANATNNMGSTKITIEDDSTTDAPKKNTYQNLYGTLFPAKKIKSFYDANAFAILTTLVVLYFVGLLIAIVMCFYLCAYFNQEHLASWSWENFLNTFYYYKKWEFPSTPSPPPQT
jgi:ABC-type phosphate/phosphonate transport system permease subunit